VIVPRLAAILAGEHGTPLMRATVAVAFGRLGMVCPATLAVQIQPIFGEWCEAIMRFKNNDEKRDAFIGLCNMIVTDPSAFESKLGCVEPQSLSSRLVSSSLFSFMTIPTTINHCSHTDTQTRTQTHRHKCRYCHYTTPSLLLPPVQPLPVLLHFTRPTHSLVSCSLTGHSPTHSLTHAPPTHTHRPLAPSRRAGTCARPCARLRTQTTPTTWNFIVRCRRSSR
jgi:hypothetical protein